MQFPNLQKRLYHHRRFRQILFGSALISILLGILIVPVESAAPNATIKTWSDGLWWSIQTVTTVGYGDVTPVTDVGRVMGVLMQIVGAVLFGTLIAIIGSSMSRGQEEFYWVRLFDRLDALDGRITELQKQSGFLVKDQAIKDRERDHTT